MIKEEKEYLNELENGTYRDMEIQDGDEVIAWQELPALPKESE